MPDASLRPLGPEDHVDGPPDAPLELVMYGDFQCPYCSAAQPIVRRVRDRLGDRLRYAFRHLPIAGAAPDAQRAAEAAESAAAQGAFWPMHDALYAQRGRLGLEDVLRRRGERRAWTPSACAPTSSPACTPSGSPATPTARWPAA